MRIVTRPDFDGVVCAALLHEVEHIDHPTLWVQPGDIQKGLITIYPHDIIANLPYHRECGLWFDHHITNQPEGAFKGAFDIVPSAARVIFDFYREQFQRDFEPLVKHTDDIDSANLTRDQILHPEKYAHVILSMTIQGNDPDAAPYWEHLVRLLRKSPVEAIVTDPQAALRCGETTERNAVFRTHLIRNTTVTGEVAVTDFRSMQPAPDGNRFLVYSLFPETFVSVKIRYTDPQRHNITVSAGRSVLNDGCRVNIGKLMARFGGGGHAGAGACTFPAADGDIHIPKIIQTLEKNERLEP